MARAGVEVFLLCVLAALWGASYSLIQIALESISPLTLMAFRVLAAAIILRLVAASLGLRFPEDAKAWREFGVQAFFNSIGAWTLLVWGQRFVDSALAAALNSTSPVFVILLTAVWSRHEAVTAWRIIGVTTGIAGIAMVFEIGDARDGQSPIVPQAAILASAFLYALAAIYGTRFARRAPVTTAAATMIWASVVLCPLAIMVEQPWTQNVSLRSALAATALAVFSTAIALLIYFRLIKTLGSVRVASQTYLRSVIAVFIGVTFLDETLSAQRAIGVALTVLGMVMIHRVTSKSTKISRAETHSPEA